MKFPLAKIEQIVKEELANHIKSLYEAGGEVVDAANDKKDAEDKAEKGKPEKAQAKDKPKKGSEPKKQPDAADKSDDELEKQADGEEEPDAEKASGDSISDELEGKSIQSITQEPKSKLVPGAQEIVVQFSDVPDPLRIIVTKAGVVKFFYKTLHNEI